MSPEQDLGELSERYPFTKESIEQNIPPIPVSGVYVVTQGGVGGPESIVGVGGDARDVRQSLISLLQGGAADHADGFMWKLTPAHEVETHVAMLRALMKNPQGAKPS